MKLDLSSTKVVVADDMELMRSLIEGLLRTAGVGQVAVAESGAEAWDLIRRAPPDLVISDWNMANGTGINLLRNIRTSPKSPNPFLPVMLLTAFREEECVHQALAAGVTAYLVKPMRTEDFYQRLEFCLRDSRDFEVSEDYFGPCREEVEYI